MARFYAKFDGGSVSALDSVNGAGGYFTQRRIAATSASGALLRDGLIASRSAVSADVYDDLDSANRNGNNGTYFPPDIPTFPTATLISWSTAYSSSVDGIKTPTTNTYGVADSLNYSKRVTESVVSTQPTLVGPTNPNDPVQLNYNVYVSASSAVRTTILSIVTGSSEVGLGRGSVSTPYGRLGQNESRTLHSIWHDPTLNYFAWDDFTPGPISSLVTHSLGPVAMVGCPPTMSLGNPVNIDLQIFVRVGVNPQYVYPNDGNQDAEIGFTVVLYETGSTTLVARLQLGGPQDTSPYANGGPLQIGDYTTGTGPLGNRGISNSTWEWNSSGGYTGELTWTIPLKDGEYDLYSYAIIHDVIVTSNTSQGQCTTYPTQAGTLGGRCNQLSFKIAAGDPS